MAEPPTRRPAIRAVSKDDVAAAIGRLLVVAQADTLQSARCTDFLLAWWNGDDDLGEDMLVVIAFLSQHPGAIYADAFGYRDAMAALAERERDLDRPELQHRARVRIRLLLDRISDAARESEDRKTPIPVVQAASMRRQAGLAKTLTDLLASTGDAATGETLRATIAAADHLLGWRRPPEEDGASLS